MKVVMRSYRLAALLLIVQGAGHTFFGGPMFYDALSQDLIWFLGAGLGIMLLGLLNLAPYHALPAWFRWAAVVANAWFLLLMLGLLTTSQSWRVVAVVILALACVLGSVLAAIEARKVRNAAVP